MKDNVSIGVMTSIKLKDRYTACKNTWAKDFENIYFFGGNLSDNNLIKIPQAGENWASAFLKQQIGLKIMWEKNPNLDWYCIVGCDTVMFKNNILDFVSNKNPQEKIIFCEKNVQDFLIDKFEFKSFCGGAGFLMSNALMREVYPEIDTFNENWKNITRAAFFNGKKNIRRINYAWGDVALSYLIQNKLNVSLTHIDGLYAQPPNFYKKLASKPMSFHYIKPHEMSQIYQKYR